MDSDSFFLFIFIFDHTVNLNFFHSHSSLNMHSLPILRGRKEEERNYYCYLHTYFLLHTKTAQLIIYLLRFVTPSETLVPALYISDIYNMTAKQLAWYHSVKLPVLTRNKTNFPFPYTIISKTIGGWFPISIVKS